MQTHKTALLLSLLLAVAFTVYISFVLRSKAELTSEKLAVIENLTESLVVRVSLLESLASKIRKDTSRSVASLRKRQGGIASREARPGSGQDDMKNVQQKQPVNIEAAKALSSIRRYIDSLETQHKALKKEIAAEGEIIREARTQGQWVVGVLGLGIVAIGFPFARSLFGRAKESKDKQV